MADKTEQLEAELATAYQRQIRLELQITDLESQLATKNVEILNQKQTIRELMSVIPAKT